MRSQWYHLRNFRLSRTNPGFSLASTKHVSSTTAFYSPKSADNRKPSKSTSLRPKWYESTPTESGVVGVKRRNKKSKNYVKDVDEDFMAMWSKSESYFRDQLKAVTTGTTIPRRKYKFWEPNVSTLPLTSELSLEERSQLLEDSSTVGYRIPKAEDFAGLTPTYTSLTEVDEEEDEGIKKIEKSEGEEPIVKTYLSFEDFELHPKILEKLKKYGITTPTEIQKQAIPLIMDQKTVLIQSETGSGKTLVFLLPTIQDPGKAFGTVIVVPTRELASQMLYEAHRFLGAKEIAASFVSGVDMAKQAARLEDTTHHPWIVIGTPKRLLEMVENDASLFRRTKRIIIDEVDKTLLPLHRRAGWKKMVTRENHPRPAKLLVEKIKKSSNWASPMQLIGASATVNDELQEDLVDLGWGDHVTVIKSPTLEGKHRSVPSCIKHHYIMCDESVGRTKAQTLARIFKESGQKSALVFIHRLHSVDKFVWELRDLGVKAEALYKKVANQDSKAFKEFLHQFQTGKIDVVVGTEETVRGLDFKDLDHVYLMEVAKNIDEYLHLAGRVGRQGRPGTATTLISRGDDGAERRMKLEYRRLELPFEEIILD